MKSENKIFIRPLFYNRLGPCARQYFQPGRPQPYFRPLMQKYFQRVQALFQAQKKTPSEETSFVRAARFEETAFVRGVRFAENDVNFARVYPLLPEMSSSERFEMAKIACKKVSGKTDCTNFVRYTLPKFSLPPENESLIVKDLDQKTGGFVRQALHAQYGK